MSPEIKRQILRMIEYPANSRPSAIEFEMAYQARIAIDRIRFAIRHTEQFAARSDHSGEAGLQLLDALERLESVDRRFQERSQTCLESRFASMRTREALDGHRTASPDERTTDRANELSREAVRDDSNERCLG